MGHMMGQRGLGQTVFWLPSVSIDPMLLLLGMGALALAMFLFGGEQKPKRRKRKIATLRKKIEQLKSEE